MKMKQEYKGNIKTFVFEGRLDSISTPAIQKQILSDIERGEIRLMIDLSAVDYISSAGVRALVLIQKEVNRHKGTLYLVDVPKNIENVFQITGFLSLFTIVKKSDIIYTPDKGE